MDKAVGDEILERLKTQRTEILSKIGTRRRVEKPTYGEELDRPEMREQPYVFTQDRLKPYDSLFMGASDLVNGIAALGLTLLVLLAGLFVWCFKRLNKGNQVCQ